MTSPQVGPVYSRPVSLRDLHDLAPGDLVDVSTTLLPYWEPVVRTGWCGDDPDGPADCEAECVGVVFYTAGDGTSAWHVGRHDAIRARLDATATSDVAGIAAENAIHDRSTAVRFGAAPDSRSVSGDAADAIDEM
ncbi:hypothetical protein [Catenuloplanes japonicus]|uniref:hypothetical protein n=1 Tax=Catenuloplanes japonicus TaxID=33876 RepID=UPI0005240925|nr:hypothetical protein [Catenuloplanes japonicus]